MRIKKMLSLFMALIMTLTLLPANVFAADDPTSPTLTKTAEWINQEVGLAKITLTAKGTPIDVTAKSGADVLVVLDASGSMGDHATEKCGGDLELKCIHGWFGSKHYYYECPKCGATYDVDEVPSDLKCTQKVYMDESRWEIATDAVRELIDQVIPDNDTANRMGTILFSADNSSNAMQNYYGDHEEAIKRYQDFTNNKNEIMDACDDSPAGGTDYTGALQKAFDMIDSRTDKSRPVYLIFLSDGAPGGWSGWSDGNRIRDTDWNGANEIDQIKSTSDNNDVTIYTVGFGLDDYDAIELLQDYATKSAYACNITDGNELSGLFTDIGNTIESGVTVWDTIDSQYFTLANKPGTNVRYEASNGTVQCTGDKQFVWNLDNFSKDGETLEIYIQLKSKYKNKNQDYTTNKANSAYGKYVGTDGKKVDLPVSEENGSSSVPTLNVNKAIKVQFNFVGENQSKATFDVPAQANQTLESGNNVTRPNVTVAPGYKITDWYETANCTGVPFDFSTPVTGNGTITLHARVDKDSSAKYAYQVEFYKNGAKSETKNGNVWAGAPSITLGNAKAMKTGNYTNYSFAKAELGLHPYTQDEDVIAIGQDGNTVIKVYYTAGAVDLTFQRGDYGKFSASGDEDKTSVTKSTHFDASFKDTPGVTAKLGWKTVGWYEAEDVAHNIVTFPQTVTGAKTYVMLYEKNPGDWKSVNFYLNNGTSAQHKVVEDILVGSSVAPDDWPSNPDRIGYKFKGWFTKDGTDDDWGTQFTQSTKVNETINVYAKWDANTADGGKIVNVDNTDAPLEGGEFVFNQTNLSADNSHKNEYPISQDFVYGEEYTVKQKTSTVGYDKVSDFKVKLKADGTSLELVGTVENVTVNGMTITVANKIDANQKFAYTVNRYIKGTKTDVPGLPALTDESPLGNFTWTNAAKTTTGYKLMANQPERLRITADETKNIANVYYEVDDSQTRSYKVTYWKDGETTPFDTSNNLTVLEADPKVAYGSISMENKPTGYELKGVEFNEKPFNSGKVEITSSANEIKVTYQKDPEMWADVVFHAGDHGKLNDDKEQVGPFSVLKDTTVEDLGGVPTTNPDENYEFIGWLTDGGATLIQNEDLPKTITQSATYTAQWTQIYNVKYYVYEKKNGNDKTITAKFDSEEDAKAAAAEHIPHNSKHYSGALLSNQSKISNVDLAKFAISTKPDKKDRTETDNAKFADLIRNYQNKEALNAVYTKAPGYDVVPFRLVLEGSVVHVDCYLVKNPEQWTTITFKPGNHGKWANDTTEDVVVDAIKGTAWSKYSSQVPANPVQNEVGWKLADTTWKPVLPNANDTIPNDGLAYTAQWVADDATVSFEIVGDKHGAVNPDDVSVQKGTKTTAPTVTADKGYQVVGWYTDDGCADAFEFSNTTITENTKLYAKVVEKAEDWTTITFKVGNHGKWANDETEDIVLNAIKGTAWSNYSSQVPANPVQNEIGWKLADGVWDNAILGDDDVIPDNSLVYTAVWTEDMADVSFQIKGIMVEGAEQFFGVVKPDNQTIQKGKMAADPTESAAENIQQGYKFDGWFTDEECTNAFAFSNTISEKTVLYSKVSIKDEDWAKVTFKAGANGTINDGSGDVETIVTDPILIGNTIGRTIPSAKANTGYEFNAWYKVTEGQSGTEEVQETPKTDTLVEGDMTYLAKFAPLLNVNFIINTTKAAEGTTSPVTISGISNGKSWASIADQVPNVQGILREDICSHDYEFTGWDADFPETVTSNLTFTAQFDDIYSFVVEHADINDKALDEDVYPYEEVKKPVKKKAGEEISSQANAPLRGFELNKIIVQVGKEDKLAAETPEEFSQLIETLLEDYNLTLTEDGTLSGKMPNDCIWIKYGYEKLAERTVAYVSDGTVKNMPENITDQYKGDEIEISTQVPQRDGFDFDGWTVVDDTVAVTDGKFIMPDSDVKLKAEWTPNEEVWNFTVEHYLEGADTPFDTVPDSVLKREPNIESVVLNAPQGYKFKEYQINGDPTELPITISEDDNTLSVIYENNDLIVKHVYGDKTVYDTTQSKENIDAESVVVNAVNSGRYTRLRSVTVNGEAVTSSRSITLDFSETGKNEVVFVYRKKKSNSGGTSDPGNSSDNGSDFGEEVTILDEEVPLADGLNVIDHFAYIFGYKDGTVRPTNRISREEVAAIFYRLLSDDVRASMKSTTQDFPDVSSQRWSNTSIATLSNGEVIAGYPNGEFRPGNSITRAEFAVIVSKFDNLSKADTNQFTDIENHWAKDFINSAALKGWISGYPDGTFHPNDYITRAEAMTLINSVLNRKVSKEGLLEDAKYWSDNSEDAWYYEAVMEATNSHDYTRETPTGDETWTAITPDKTWD